MKKFFKWIKDLFGQETIDSPQVVIIPPVEPLPEIPTQEEADNFPPKSIKDFKFVDTSHHHPDFDPIKYALSPEFLGVTPVLSNKCTQGTSFIDKTHNLRKKQCAENGIKYGGYHFYECKKDPIQQAKFYVDTHGSFEIAPQVDFETTTGQTEQDLFNDKEDLYKCLCEIERLTGKTPCLYLNYGAAGRLKFDAKFGRFIAWFARYNSSLGPIPLPWTSETTGIWQFTENGIFPGFKGGNDVNIYYGKVNVFKL